MSRGPIMQAAMQGAGHVPPDRRSSRHMEPGATALTADLRNIVLTPPGRRDRAIRPWGSA